MNLNVTSNECWVCGDPSSSTHHALPMYLKPKNNVLVPVCAKCHHRINSSDVSGLFAYAYKLEQQGIDIAKHAKRLTALIEENIRRNRESLATKGL